MTSTDPHILVHPSGEWSTRILIMRLTVTPLTLLLGADGATRWLRRHRRHLVVAAFAYAALHALFYLGDKADAAHVMAELPRLYVRTGWLALAVMVPLAATAAGWAARRMGRNWKRLQRASYTAAALALVHRASLHDWGYPLGAVLHFAPLAALEGSRLRRWRSGRHRPAVA